MRSLVFTTIKEQAIEGQKRKLATKIMEALKATASFPGTAPIHFFSSIRPQGPWHFSLRYERKS